MKPVFAYVGSYTTENKVGDRFVTDSKGIEVFSVDPANGSWKHLQTVEQLNPMYLLLDKEMKTLYAASSDSNLVYAYRINQDTGTLSPLNACQLQGKSTLCLGLSRDGSHLVVGSMSGHIASIKIADDGSFSAICDEFRLQDPPGPLTYAQPWARAHHSVFDEIQGFCYIVDKGCDAVHIEKLDMQTGKLTRVGILHTRPGECARHIVFHPNGRYAYINTEYIGTVISCRWNPSAGTLEPFQILPTPPENYVGNYSLSSEIQIHPSGKFLYVSNRGDNSIAEFSIDPVAGKLKSIGWVKTGGTIPRYFCIEPGGQFLYVCNQGSGNIKSFSINQDTGKLSFTGQTIKTATPVWLLLTGPISAISQPV
ncbi:MAG: lactonase family protein [Pyramidobacter sp.]|jgi:6-phosphogluconolactonase